MGFCQLRRPGNRAFRHGITRVAGRGQFEVSPRSRQSTHHALCGHEGLNGDSAKQLQFFGLAIPLQPLENTFRMDLVPHQACETVLFGKSPILTSWQNLHQSSPQAPRRPSLALWKNACQRPANRFIDGTNRLVSGHLVEHDPPQHGTIVDFAPVRRCTETDDDRLTLPWVVRQKVLDPFVLPPASKMETGGGDTRHPDRRGIDDPTLPHPRSHFLRLRIVGPNDPPALRGLSRQMSQCCGLA